MAARMESPSLSSAFLIVSFSDFDGVIGEHEVYITRCELKEGQSA